MNSGGKSTTEQAQREERRRILQHKLETVSAFGSYERRFESAQRAAYHKEYLRINEHLARLGIELKSFPGSYLLSLL